MCIISLTSGKSFNSIDGASILDASSSSMVYLPYSCKSGRCSSCKCKVIKGLTVALQEETGLTADEKNEGWILSCVRVAKTDVTLEVEDLDGTLLPPKKTLPCKISSIEKLAPDVIKIMLCLPPASAFNYFPGQYIEVIGACGLRRSYSLAGASRADKQLELHIRRVAGGALSKYWFDTAKVGDLLRLNGPLGTFFLRHSVANRDLIFLATGTGFAPIKAMLESLVNMPLQKQPKSVNIYWGARKLEDLYWDFKRFQLDFRFTPVLSRAHAEWSGAVGYVQQVALTMHSELDNASVYACGSTEMIQSAKTVLTNAGLPANHFFSDAFVCSANN